VIRGKSRDWLLISVDPGGWGLACCRCLCLTFGAAHRDEEPDPLLLARPRPEMWTTAVKGPEHYC